MHKPSVFRTGISLVSTIVVLHASEAAAHQGHGLATTSADIFHHLFDWHHAGVFLAIGLVCSIGVASYLKIVARRRVGTDQAHA